MNSEYQTPPPIQTLLHMYVGLCTRPWQVHASAITLFMWVFLVYAPNP